MKKILIVEDEIALSHALADKLTSESFEILTAGDGQKGLELALELHPDLILLDIVMPKKDGLTVLSELRADTWGSKVPVIILTNLSDAEIGITKIDHMNTEYLIKTDWKLADVVKKVKEKIV